MSLYHTSETHTQSTWLTTVANGVRKKKKKKVINKSNQTEMNRVHEISMKTTTTTATTTEIITEYMSV